MSRTARHVQSTPPTITDVAKAARVSTATVSRVMAGLNGAGPAARKRVLDAVRALNYEPNRIARNLRSRTRKLVGVVIPDLQNPFFTGIVRGIEEVLTPAGYTVLLANSDDDPQRERDELRVLRAEGASGILWIPCDLESGNAPRVRATEGPVVAIDRAPDRVQVDLVKTANTAGAFAAVNHLIQLGHKSLGLINGPKHYDVARERLAGFEEALARAGLSPNRDWIAHSDFRHEGGYVAAKKLLAGRSRPRALFVTNYLMTLGALQAIHELGLEIPKDVALVSFDDMPWSISLNPPLTAVAQPTQELGRTAAQLLLERYAHPNRPCRQVVLQPTLIVRASCGANPRGGKT